MQVFRKSDIKEQLNTEKIFELLENWGGQPQYTKFGIVSDTICHNEPGEGSRKLYYYENTELFRCYTGCQDPTFDIFELVIKIQQIQKHIDYDLNDAVLYIVNYFGLSGVEIYDEHEDALEDWKILAEYEKIYKPNGSPHERIQLKEYDKIILDRFSKIKIQPWIDEGIKQGVMTKNKIMYYPGQDQIVIPHYDIDGRFIGLRGRFLGEEESKQYGKYRPLRVNQFTYSHPLGLNLYNLNNSKKNIARSGKVVVFEGEKSALKFQSYFGHDTDISVACCGSNLTFYHVNLLLDSGAKEIIVAFDRQFQTKGDDEFKHLTKNLTRLHERYKKEVLISFIFDKEMITPYKSSPIDQSPNTFMQLFKNRIIL